MNLKYLALSVSAILNIVATDKAAVANDMIKHLVCNIHFTNKDIDYKGNVEKSESNALRSYILDLRNKTLAGVPMSKNTESEVCYDLHVSKNENRHMCIDRTTLQLEYSFYETDDSGKHTFTPAIGEGQCKIESPKF